MIYINIIQQRLYEIRLRRRRVSCIVTQTMPLCLWYKYMLICDWGGWCDMIYLNGGGMRRLLDLN